MGRHRAGPPDGRSSDFDAERPAPSPAGARFDPEMRHSSRPAHADPPLVGLGPDPVPPAPARRPDPSVSTDPVGLSVRMLLMTLVAGLLAAVALSVASLLPR